MAQQIQDEVQADGSVIRTTTFTTTQTFTAAQYAKLATNLQTQITAQQATLATLQTNITTSAANAAKLATPASPVQAAQ